MNTHKINEVRRSGARTITGRIDQRLLINAVVDPPEVAAHLPDRLRPHVTDDGITVVGCCLLEIDEIGPRWAPDRLRTLRSVAHRMSVEWIDDAGELHVGVYVPQRATSSIVASMVGGRWFPGVQTRADISVVRSESHIAWTVASGKRAAIELAVRVDLSPGSAPVSSDTVGAVCLDASIGLSPDRRGGLEGAQMALGPSAPRVVAVDHLHSSFLDSFASAVPAPSYLMEAAPVAWSAVRELTPA